MAADGDAVEMTKSLRGKTVSIVVAAMLGLSCPACEGVGPGSVSDDSLPRVSYYPERVFFVAGADKIVVMGYYEGHGELAECSLEPRLWTRHEFRFDQPGTLHLRYAVPMAEGMFAERTAPLAAAAQTPIVLSIPGYGQVTVQGGAWQYQSERAPYSIVCARVEFSVPGRPDPLLLSLVCSGCGGHRCHDGTCDADEDETSCPADCLTRPSPCGDLYCASGEQYHCLKDCRCDDWLCAMRTTDVDDTQCVDVYDEWLWGVCQGILNPDPCDGTEPFCLSHGGEGIPDEMVQRCDPGTGTRIQRGCDQECWERYGTVGICDLGGTEECVCL